jgi:hypothetical protein
LAFAGTGWADTCNDLAVALADAPKGFESLRVASKFPRPVDPDPSARRFYESSLRFGEIGCVIQIYPNGKSEWAALKCAHSSQSEQDVTAVYRRLVTELKACPAVRHERDISEYNGTHMNASFRPATGAGIKVIALYTYAVDFEKRQWFQVKFDVTHDR